MLDVCFITSLLYVTARSLDVPTEHNDQPLIQCVTSVLGTYFTQYNDLTIVSLSPDDDELLRKIHSSMQLSIIHRHSTYQMFVPNHAYLVFSDNVETYVKYFDELRKDPTWNPYARFLIIIKLLRKFELRRVFDVLLRLHVNNVLLVNGTDHAHLYTYNPFDHYACGRYYHDVINYGQCSHTTHDLYPNKLVTGLNNCTYRASVKLQPPFTIDPNRNPYRYRLPGMEQYVLDMVAGMDGFKMDYKFNYGTDFSIVTPNMTATGPLYNLQINATDVGFGGLMTIASRTDAFTYVRGYHDYGEELQFAVKKAENVPTWQNFYLVFDPFVWFLLLIAFLIYCGIMIRLLRNEDKGRMILGLLDILLSQGFEVGNTWIVKCILLVWVWFACLVNVFYTSNLVSLTTNPSKEYQIQTEADLFRFKMRPCTKVGFVNYLFNASTQSDYLEKHWVNHPDCDDMVAGLKLVSHQKDKYAILPSYILKYHMLAFNDKWGDSLIYRFEKPYGKLMFTYFFYKGFPISDRFLTNMVRMKEYGFTDKILEDHYFLHNLKYRFLEKDLESRFVFPWCLYIAGCGIAVISFIIEVLNMRYLKRVKTLEISSPI